MIKLNRSQLLAEAEAQNKALKTIKKWLAYAIGLSTIGAALTLFAFSGKITIIGVVGIILTFLSVTAALIINLGIKRGTANVEKILMAVENEKQRID